MPKKKKEEEITYSLDEALKAAKKAETSLQDMLQGVSDGVGFYKRSQKGAEAGEKIKPKLDYEKKRNEKNIILKLLQLSEMLFQLRKHLVL
ncbi:MAG: hypothetical protein P8Y97_23135 [Candidatus Lokiarchaeota archaeon]